MTSTISLPVRSENSEEPSGISPKAHIEMRLNLLLKLVERIKSLPQVRVKNVPYLARSGVVVHVPGPFSLSLASQQSNNKSLSTSPNTVFMELSEEEDLDDLEEIDDEEEDRPALGASEDEEDDDEDFLAFRHRSSSDPDKFVVRNEFGHIRLQHLLDVLEHVPSGAMVNQPIHHDPLEIGGHCVLPKPVFDDCIVKGWGKPHVFAGRYHPIVGTMIPETTLVFVAPRSEEELEVIWSIIQLSYQWALKSEENEEKDNTVIVGASSSTSATSSPSSRPPKVVVSDAEAREMSLIQS